VSGSRTTRVYLVRHGTTDWNQIGRLQGLLDTRLNATGLREASGLAARFRSGATPVSRVIASPLSRARTTADIVSRRLAIPLDTDARLREVDHGDWTGLTIAQIARRHPDAVDRQDHLQGDAPIAVRAEPLAAVYRRASALLADLLDAHLGQSLIIVGHGVTNALLCGAAAGGCDTAHLQAPPAPNTGGMVMTFHGRQLAACRPLALEGRP
jgi:broad specificity phosphatase PhoE